MLEPEPTDVFKFSMTLYHGRDQDTIRLPCQFVVVVDD
jgi:hypothetical protein